MSPGNNAPRWKLEELRLGDTMSVVLFWIDPTQRQRSPVAYVVGGRARPDDQRFVDAELTPLLGSDVVVAFFEKEQSWRQAGVAFGLRYGVRTPLAYLDKRVSSSCDRHAFRRGYDSGRDFVRRRGLAAVL